MAQFQVGTVRVDSTTAIVKHIWQITYITGGSAFTAAEAVTWGGGGGSGFFVREDTVGKKLFFYRNSGAEPAVGETVTGGTSGETRVVDTLASSSPPDYDNPTTGISQGDKFIVEDQGVIHTVSGTIGNDQFTLTATYTETTTNEAAYAVVRDFTSFFSWPTPELGDLDPIAIINEAITRADERLKFRGYFQQAITSSGGTASINWTNGHAAAITLSENTTLTFTAPEGPGVVTLNVVQDSDTAKSITWPATAKWPAGAAPALLLAPLSSVNVVRFYYDGTNYLGDFTMDVK